MPFGSVVAPRRPSSIDASASADDVRVARGRRREPLQHDRRPAGDPGLLDARDEVRRHEPAPVLEQRIETRHLQRRHQQVLLADRELDRVARLPEPLDLPCLGVALLRVRLPLPADGRQQAGILAADVEAAGLAEAEVARPALQGLAAARRQVVKAVADLVEIGVAGGGERGRQRHRLVHERVPVVEDLLVAAEDRERRALDRLVGREQALLHRRERRHGLPRRAGRVAARGGAVDERVVRVRRGERVQLLRVRAADVEGRLVCRVRRERQHLAVRGVESDDRAAVRPPVVVLERTADAVGDRLLRRPLQPDVEREPDGVARHPELLHLERALRPAERVDAELRPPRRAAEVLVERRFHARLTDTVAGAVALVHLRLQLVLRDLADVAEHLGGERLVLVVPQERGHDRDARELRLVLLQVERPLGRHGRPHRDRRQRIALPSLDRLRDLRRRHAEDRGEALHHPVAALLRHVGGPELDDGAGDVRDERAAVAVEDRPARRLGAHRPHLVLPRCDEVAVAGEDLQSPQPQEEHREGGEGDGGEDADAQRELRREAIRLGHTRVGRQEAAGRRAALVEGASQRACTSAVRSDRSNGGRSLRQTAKTGAASSRFRPMVGSSVSTTRRADTSSPMQEVEGEAADRDEHGHDDDREERRVQAVAPGGLGVAPGPVAGDGEQQRGHAERVERQDVEQETAAEPGDGAGDRAAEQRDADQRQEQEVGRAAEDVDAHDDRRLQQGGDEDQHRDRGGVAHRRRLASRGTSTATASSDAKSTPEASCTCW